MHTYATYLLTDLIATAIESEGKNVVLTTKQKNTRICL